MEHRPVLLESVVALLGSPGRILDATLGFGGHSEALLEGGAQVVGIDRDPDARRAAAERLARFKTRFMVVPGRFGDINDLVQGPFDAILADIGVSSPQLDRPERGFSFREDGPLDMRMDPSTDQSAADLLADIDEASLVRILREFGEEPRARRIARGILSERPFTGTLALAEVVAMASGYRGGRTHPATRTFQAIRIAVNDELGELSRFLAHAPALLAPGGRLGIITFHSLEDRLVKRGFRQQAGIGAPKDAYGHPLEAPQFRLVGKPVVGKDVDAGNPRARSARLRVLERIPT